MPMARIRDVRTAKQADVDVELARRSSRANGTTTPAAANNGSSERHTPHAAEGAPQASLLLGAGTLTCSLLGVLRPSAQSPDSGPRSPSPVLYYEHLPG